MSVVPVCRPHLLWLINHQVAQQRWMWLVQLISGSAFYIEKQCLFVSSASSVAYFYGLPDTSDQPISREYDDDHKTELQGRWTSVQWCPEPRQESDLQVHQTSIAASPEFALTTRRKVKTTVVNILPLGLMGIQEPSFLKIFYIDPSHLWVQLLDSFIRYSVLWVVGTEDEHYIIK